ncbi:hypothetical protein [Streptomyces sp. NPDC002537]
MAVANPSADERTAAPSMARPGYGKRSAPDQKPRRKDDFAHLPAREAAIATYIDRLPDGAAIDVKTLAKELAAYGQQAVRTALNALAKAGHLLRRREPVGDGGTQWVFRTYFSRTARNDSWWKRFLRGDVPREDPAPAPVEEEPPPPPGAYKILASIGRTDPRMTLSARECAQLEPLANEWFARGATERELIHALTAGLPPEVHCPGAMARRRLTNKMPPERDRASASTPAALMECEGCRTPSRHALPGGRCRACRGDDRHEGWVREAFAESTRRHAAALRSEIRKRRTR